MKHLLILLVVVVLFTVVGCEEGAPKSLLISSPGQTGIIVDPSSLKYEEIKDFPRGVGRRDRVWRVSAYCGSICRG